MAKSRAHIAWRDQETNVLELLDRKRVTEEGAEAVALACTFVRRMGCEAKTAAVRRRGLVADK